MNLITIFKMILSLSFMGSIVAGIIFLIKIVFKNKLNTKWHYYIWILLIIRLIVPFAPESSLSIFNLFSFNPSSIEMSHVNVNNPDTNITISQNNDETVIHNNSTIQNNSLNKSNDIATTSNSSWINYNTISVVWVIGVVIMLFHMLFVNVKFLIKLKKQPHCNHEQIIKIFEECKSKMNILISIPIIYDNTLKTPALFGLIKPKLLISNQIVNNLTDDENKYIFLHELSHLRRMDILINWITVILKAIHWFNPIIWYAFYKMSEDCEVACDAYVLSHIEPSEHKKYGETIINILKVISTPYWTPVTTGMANNKTSIKRRIKMITMFKKNTYKWSIVAVILILLVGLISLTNSISDKNELDISNVNLNKLLEYRNSYVGDNSAVGGVLYNLPYGMYVKRFELETNNQPYGIKVDYGVEKLSSNKKDDYIKEYKEFVSKDENVKKILLNNATTLFILIKNVDKVQLNLDSANNLTLNVTREELENFYGRDLREYATDKLLWQKEVLEGSIYSSEIFNSLYEHKNIEKIIDEKLNSIVNNKDIAFSSNPYDYINNNKEDYDFIVSQGQEALTYLLLQFENTNQNGLREYIMAIICSQITGNELQYSSGREWYESYIENNEISKEGKNIKLYFGDDNAEYLIGEVRKLINPTPKSIIQELIKGPISTDLHAVWPENTKVIEVEIKDKIAYVNFGESLEESMEHKYGTSAMSNLLLYSLINTLTSCDEFDIDKVQILIEGQKKIVLGPIAIEDPIDPNFDLIKQ